MLKKCDIKFFRLTDLHNPYSESKTYLRDQTGTKIYKFNSLGYRGEEYNPMAKKKIFVCGCSLTFGVGLNIEKTWPHQFKKIVVQNERLNPNDINLLNFSVGGQSNDYITRTLLSQCNSTRPDLCIAYFTFIERTEYIDKEKPSAIVPWLAWLRLDPCHFKKYRRRRSKIIEKALSFYDYYTDELGFINLLKNMLLLQFFFKQNKIKYIFGSVNIHNKFTDKNLTSNPIISQFMRLFDSKHLISFEIETVDRAVDRGMEDGEVVGHPGPQSNKLFAEKLFKFYKENIK